MQPILKFTSKHLVLFIYLISNLVIAQDAKPTKEQTITYIKSQLEENNINVGCKISSGEFYSQVYTNFLVELNNEILVIEWTEEEQYLNAPKKFETLRKFKEKISINLRKIESVESRIQSGGYCRNSTYGYELAIHLTAVPGYKMERSRDQVSNWSKENGVEDVDDKIRPEKLQPSEFSIVIANTCLNCVVTERNNKLISAVKHLRKLCGAPDPLKFD